MSSLATNAITDAAGGNTATINGQTPTESNMAGRNRIINGDMRIDQRNAGASVTTTGGNTYTPDRWLTYDSIGSKLSVQQVLDAPLGFINSQKITSLAATTPSSTDYYFNCQRIEGFNVADFGWGTAAASTVTLSFWVKSSLTGSFSGAFGNASFNRSYPFSYAINAANTWEKKTVTVAGDTNGTWSTGNSTGIQVVFDLGSGSSRAGTADTWSANDYRKVTGSVNLISTLNATWQITGVQLEAGSVATPFEHRQYGQELALCQRYAFATNGSNGIGGVGDTTTRGQQFIVPEMRATPTLTTLTAGSVNMTDGYSANPSASNATFTLSHANPNFARVSIGGFSGLTSGRWMSGIGNGTAVILFSAEL